MRLHLSHLVALVLAGAVLGAAKPDKNPGQNAAYYQGESLNYIVFPPDKFHMVDWEATADGYSFAFIPDAQEYETANLIIGVNIFKIRGLQFTNVVSRDTTALRQHYGKDVALWPVDSITTASGQRVTAFFINDTTHFIPNVMIAYVDGHTELLVFELVITDRATRVKAEDTFVQCLRRVKALPIGELGSR